MISPSEPAPDLGHPPATRHAGGHEPDDVHTRGLVLAFAGLGLTLGIVAFAARLLSPAHDPALPTASDIPNTPARQDWGSEGQDERRRLREREDANLAGDDGGPDAAPRMSIKDAMEALVRRGRGAEPGEPAP